MLLRKDKIVENAKKLLEFRNKKNQHHASLEKAHMLELGKATELTFGAGRYGYESNNRQMHNQGPKYYC